MFAQTKPEVVADAVETLLRIGLGPIGRADLVLAKYSCIALGRVGGSVKKVKGACTTGSISLGFPAHAVSSAGSLNDVQVRLPMDSAVFSRLADTIQAPSSSREWFSMAEQAVNTIYTLGDQPDALCSEVLRQMTARVFGPKPAAETAEGEPKVPAEGEDAAMAEDAAAEDEVIGEKIDEDEAAPPAGASHDPATGNAFELSQLVFVAGHCAIKQLVHLELVERDLKRRKAEDEKAKGGKKAGDDELDQVAGSVEDEIGDVIATAKEKELLYAPASLLAVFGPMAATIVAQPKVYKVRRLRCALKTYLTLATHRTRCCRRRQLSRSASSCVSAPSSAPSTSCSSSRF